MKNSPDRTSKYRADSLSLIGAVALGTGFLGATALGILAFKGFTTITNSGSKLKDPHRNLGRAIMISIALCVVIYALVGFAVASNLSLQEIVATRNDSLAAAASLLFSAKLNLYRIPGGRWRGSIFDSFESNLSWRSIK